MDLTDGRIVHSSLSNADITDAGCSAQPYSEVPAREMFVVRLVECHRTSNRLRLTDLVGHGDGAQEVLWEPCVGDYGDFLG